MALQGETGPAGPAAERLPGTMLPLTSAGLSWGMLPGRSKNWPGAMTPSL